MNIVVCVKQIPDPAASGSLDPQTKTLDRSGKLVMDEADSYGVEMALQLLEDTDGEVELVSMAPRSETAGLRTALAMGAHGAVVASDDALAGSDSLGTAKVLTKIIKDSDPDLVIMATESTDGYTGVLPVQVAELLGLPSVTFAKSIALDGGDVVITRQTDVGFDEVRCPLPAVVTVTAGVVTPRYPSFKGIMAAKGKPLEVRSLDDLGLSSADVGKPGSRQEIIEVAAVESRKAGDVVADDGTGDTRIVDYLSELKVL